MSNTKNISEHSERSEKAIEQYLCERLERLGGIALKYSNDLRTGYPDRLCLLPDGHTFWVELKSKGKHPRAIQQIRITELRDLGQRVYVADSRELVDLIIKKEYEIHGTPLSD